LTRIGENSSNPKEMQRKGNLFHEKFLKYPDIPSNFHFKSHHFFTFCKLNLRTNSG